MGTSYPRLEGGKNIPFRFCRTKVKIVKYFQSIKFPLPRAETRGDKLKLNL
jgi:hypothetical protein